MTSFRVKDRKASRGDRPAVAIAPSTLSAAKSSVTAAYLFSACLWFVCGIQRCDKTIYLACIGWIALDAAIIIGATVHR